MKNRQVLYFCSRALEKAREIVITSAKTLGTILKKMMEEKMVASVVSVFPNELAEMSSL